MRPCVDAEGVGSECERIEQTACCAFVYLFEGLFAVLALLLGGEGNKFSVIFIDAEKLGNAFSDLSSAASVLSCNGDNNLTHRYRLSRHTCAAFGTVFFPYHHYSKKSEVCKGVSFTSS